MEIKGGQIALNGSVGEWEIKGKKNERKREKGKLKSEHKSIENERA